MVGLWVGTWVWCVLTGDLLPASSSPLTPSHRHFSFPHTPTIGYRLTYGGYDILALKTLLARGHIAGVSACERVGDIGRQDGEHEKS